MVKVLLRLKSNLLKESLGYYLRTHFEKLNLRIEHEASPEKVYDVVIYDKSSLKESSVNDFPLSKKVLLDDGSLDQEITYLVLYYKLSGVYSVETPPELFPKCIDVVLQGDLWLSKDLTEKLSKNYETFSKKDVPTLTKREKEIVKWVCEGLKNKEIAKKLFLSEQTVKSHLNRIFKKTGVKNRSRLIKFFYNTLIFNSGGNFCESPSNEMQDRDQRKSSPKRILKIRVKK